MQITLPRSMLPENKLLRRQILDNYFKNLIPFEQIINNQWQINTFIPADFSYYVDPMLEKSLQTWNEIIPIESLGIYWRIYKNAMLSFYDSWSLLYWSFAVQWLRTNNLMPEQIVLLHVDDHMDQGSPCLVVNDHQFNSIYCGQQIDFSVPGSIAHAIAQNSIDIGSFITPFLHSIESVKILHLRYAHSKQPKEHYLACSFAEDTLLAVGKQRPAIIPQTSESKHSYTIASTPSLLLEKANEGSPIFLHIDCDAFNNRYNGDSNWHPLRASIDLSLERIKEKIHQLLYLVGQLGVPVFMNVALSPGFFPSEYWQEVCRHIFTTAKSCGIIKNDEFSEYLETHCPKEMFNETFVETGNV